MPVNHADSGARAYYAACAVNVKSGVKRMRTLHSGGNRAPMKDRSAGRSGGIGRYASAATNGGLRYICIMRRRNGSTTR